MEIIIFIYALLLGSFLNVVGLRVPAKQSIIKPRSSCPGCGKSLTIVELIPVLSFVIQKGKCKQCKQPISLFYPIMELTTAFLFVYAFAKIGWTFELVIAWTLITLFVIIFITDIKFMLIPDKILLFFAILFIIERIIQPLQPWWNSLLGAAIAFLLLLFTVIGFVIGPKFMLISFFFANILGAVLGIIGMTCGIFERKKPIPFGPFIAIGTLITYFYYQPILAWYQSLLY